MLVAGWKSRIMIDRYTKATAVERARASHARLLLGDRLSTSVIDDRVLLPCPPGVRPSPAPHAFSTRHPLSGIECDVMSAR